MRSSVLASLRASPCAAAAAAIAGQNPLPRISSASIGARTTASYSSHASENQIKDDSLQSRYSNASAPSSSPTPTRSHTCNYRPHSSPSNASLYSSARCYSTTSSDSSMIKVTNVEAPHSGTIRILSLNRPKARNAISREFLAQLNSEISAARYDGSKGTLKALILASEVDNCFCAGADLKERQQFTHDETKVFLSYLRSAFNALASLPIPTISALASNAFGGGLELALCTKLRVFGSSARVALPETRLGIIPGAGGTYRLPQVVGQQRARDLILTGRQVSGPEAYFIGLCDRLVEITPEEAQQEGKAREKVLEEAIKLATTVAEGAPLAVKAALQAVDGWQGAEHNEMECYEKVLGTEDRDEALSAFVMKRTPVFKGR